MSNIQLYQNNGETVAHYFALCYGDDGNARGLGHIIREPLPKGKPAFRVTTKKGDEILIVAHDEEECAAILKKFFVGEDEDESAERPQAMFGGMLQADDLRRTDIPTGCLLTTSISCGNFPDGAYDPVNCAGCAFDGGGVEPTDDELEAAFDELADTELDDVSAVFAPLEGEV